MSIETNLKTKGFKKYAANPFIKQLKLEYATKKANYQVNDRNISIVDEKNGDRISEVTHMSTFHKVDSAKFTKIYQSSLRTIFQLNSAGMKVLLIVLDQVQQNIGSDEISLHSSLIEGYGISKATYTRGVRELVDADIIGSTLMPSRWFINPAIMFNGDRIVLTQRYERETEEDKNQSLDLSSTHSLRGEMIHA